MSTTSTEKSWICSLLWREDFVWVPPLCSSPAHSSCSSEGVLILDSSEAQNVPSWSLTLFFTEGSPGRHSPPKKETELECSIAVQGSAWDTSWLTSTEHTLWPRACCCCPCSQCKRKLSSYEYLGERPVIIVLCKSNCFSLSLPLLSFSCLSLRGVFHWETKFVKFRETLGMQPRESQKNFHLSLLRLIKF